MTDSESRGSLPKPILVTRLPGMALVVLIGAVAYVARLVPVVRGAGLRGTNSYDGAVYYAAAAGLAHGLLPYRDFLFLHPPGIVVALVPFAALGRVIGDPYGMEVATLAWFGIGALNAVLVSRILRPLGVLAALVGGLFYALFYPAVFIERSPLLEAPAATVTLVALLLLTRAPKAGPIASRVVLVAGALLGVSAGIKIWGVVVLVAVLGWTWVTYGARRGFLLLTGAAIGATIVCLPFFAAAPGSMWRMVVVDQLGRSRSRLGLGKRLTDMVGLTTLHAGLVAVALALAVAVAGCVLAVRSRQGRLAVVVLLTSSALLLSTPPWFVHYAGLAAAPTAIMAGAAAGTLLGVARSTRTRALIAALLMAGLAVVAVPVLSASFGRPFPAAAPIAKRAAALGGCVTTDDPRSLIQTDLLERNFRHGCTLVVDLGGYSYDIHPGTAVPRSRNNPWQRFAIDYLRSGSGVIVMRFSPGFGFSAHSASVVQGWPVLLRARHVVLRSPVGVARGS
jgi:alpha-1,2-mannosyltransferase